MKTFFCLLFAFLCQISLFAQNKAEISIRKLPSSPKYARGKEIECLYGNCANEVYIDVKENGKILTDFQVELEYGEVRRDSFDKNRFTLIPDRTRGTLKIFSNGKLILSERCQIMPMPAPVVKVYVKGNPYTPNMTLYQGEKIIIDVAAQKDFSEIAPKEATYFYPEITIFRKMTDLSPPEVLKKFTFEKIQKRYIIELPTEYFKDKCKIQVYSEVHRKGRNGKKGRTNLCYAEFLVLYFRIP
jgi:hypothetical protein